LDKIDSAIAAHWVKARERMISGYQSYLANQRISLDILKRGDQARLEETIAGRNPDLGIAEPRRDRRREGGKRSLAAVEHER
jgi:hypothetical protein